MIPKTNYKGLSTFIDFLLYSNLWVALATGAMSSLVLLFLNLQLNQSFWLITSFVFLSYNYIYYVGYISHPNMMDCKRKEWIKRNKQSLFALVSLASIYSIVALFRLNKPQIYLLILLSFFSLFYILPFKIGKGLRWIPGLKIILIALNYTLLIVSFQLIKLIPAKQLLFTSILTFLFIVALAIPFDLRDLKNDTRQLKTLPQLLGRKASILSSQLLFLLIGIVLWFNTGDINLQITNTIFILAFIGSVQFSPKQKDYFYSFWLDGIPIFWMISYLIIK